MKKRSLLTSIIVTSVLTLTAVFTTVTLLINHVVYEQNVQATQINAKLTAEAISFRIRDALHSLTAKLMLAGPTLQPDTNGDIAGIKPAEKKLIELLEQAPNLYSTWVIYEPEIYAPDKIINRSFVNNDGKIYETFDTDSHLIYDETQKWYHAPRQSKDIFFDALDFYDYRDGNGKKYVGAVSIPILRGAKLVGVYGADVLFSRIFSQISELRGDSPHFLLDAEGIIVGAVNEKYTDKKFSEFMPEMPLMAEKLKNGKPYFFEAVSPFTHKKSLIGFVPVQMGYTTYDGHLFLYVEYALDSLLGDTHNMFVTINWFMLVGGWLFIGLLFLLVWRIVRPIKQLTKAAQQIADGNLNVAFAARKNPTKNNRNEIDELQIALAKMVEKLHQNHNWEVAAYKSEWEKEQALANSQLRTEFFARMSHELRTPMNAVIGFARVLNAEELTDKQHKLSEDIVHAANLLINIVNEVLDLSRLDVGKLSLVPMHYDFQAMLAHVQSIATVLAHQKNLQFRYHPMPQLPRYLYGDETRLQQILINVLNNAIKFTENGSVELSVDADVQFLHFTIRDTGIGIKAEDLPNLFDAFRQMDMQVTNKVTGTGLGLAICKSLIHLMDGSIQVSSVYGKGTIFVVHVPIVIGSGEVLVEKRTDAAAETISFADIEAQILVVDDNETNLEVAQQTLHLLGINAVLALSGREALAKAKTIEFDLVLMDHMMPEMDGIETMNLIRGLNKSYEDLPIIVLTATALDGARETLLAEGFDDFLSKPLDFKELQRVLWRFLSVEVDDSNAEKISVAAFSQNQEVLRSIVAGGERRLAKLHELFAARDTRNYTIEVHAIKSVAATVNEMEFSALAAHHETAGNANDWKTIAATFNELTAKYAALIEKVKTQIPVEEISTAPQIKMSPSRIAELFAAIKTAAGDFSINPINAAIAELQNTELKAAEAAKLEKIRAAAELLDYDALETI